MSFVVAYGPPRTLTENDFITLHAHQPSACVPLVQTCIPFVTLTSMKLFFFVLPGTVPGSFSDQRTAQRLAIYYDPNLSLSFKS